MSSDSQSRRDQKLALTNDITRFLRILHPEGVHEVRVINWADRMSDSRKSTASGYFDDPALAATEIAKISTCTPPGIYIGVNPVIKPLARVMNRIQWDPKNSTTKTDVERRQWLFVDIQTKRASGVSSTKDEMSATWDLAKTVNVVMREAGWPKPLIGLSCSGAFLIWKIDLPNDDQSALLVKQVLTAMARRFDTDRTEVDQTAFDANRICEVLGIGSRLGDSLVAIAREPDPRLRRFCFLEPAGELRTVATSLLKAMADRCGDIKKAEREAKTEHEAVPSLALRDVANPVGAGQSDSWDEPVPIDRPKLPRFPAHVLPKRLRSWVLATAEATQTPADLAGLLGLAVCSGAVARRITIEALPDYTEPLNLWTVCLMDPAGRKSAVFKAAITPLRAIQGELIEKAGPLITARKIARDLIEAQIKAAKKKAVSGDANAATIMCESTEKLQKLPVLKAPRLLTDNCTSEVLGELLQDQGGRMVVSGSEGGLFQVLGGLYSGGTPNVDCFLRGHAGDDLQVDRVGRSSVSVDRVCLTLAYAVQPHVFKGLGRKPAMRGLGLLARFIYAIPESRIGFRRVNPEPVPDAVTADYARVVRRLADIQTGPYGPRELVLSSAASERFISWSDEVESMLRPDGRLGAIQDWGGKLVGLTARLAGVMHLASFADFTDPVAVSVRLATIESAIELARWAIPHAEAAFRLMAADDGSADDAVYVLEWLRKRAQSEVSRRDIQSHGRTRFDRDPKRLDRALDVLVDHGWFRPIVNQPRGPGRPSVRYQVHPSVTRPPVSKISRSADPTGVADGEEPSAA